MPINLTISAETVEEFDTLLERFMPDYDSADAAAPAGDGSVPAKPSPRRRKKAEAAAPTQNPDGTPIEPVHTPEPQPTPGGTDAPPAESIPPKQEAAVDPFAQNGGAGATASPAGGSPASAETVAATPAATSPTDTAAAAAGEVTVQQLKDAMADLLKAKSASFAMQTLEQATGCKSLTTGSPSVVEKAKTDPTLMQKTLDALIAAKA